VDTDGLARPGVATGNLTEERLDSIERGARERHTLMDRVAGTGGGSETDARDCRPHGGAIRHDTTAGVRPARATARTTFGRNLEGRSGLGVSRDPDHRGPILSSAALGRLPSASPVTSGFVGSVNPKGA
jgi:hypothetical protein